MSSAAVQLHIQGPHVVMDNGLLQVTLSNPDGIVTGIRYNGIDNLLEPLNKETNRGYMITVFSCFYFCPSSPFSFLLSSSSSFNIIYLAFVVFEDYDFGFQ
ncbi:hypothetical protein C1H46_042683 [Malus baccata]|uniref:Uncharacterized protein n=1 Tax=Malus baccata TaxID=106549 RepID=A0A540KC47_MALBA|nr:hypothetical protein C1H46_042683 [Malus baccata]